MYKKILFVEDDIDIAAIYAKVLESTGYEVNCAYDGEAGLQEAVRRRYDLILLDLMLPHKSGIEVLKLLRNPRQTPEFDQATDIIILTNFEVDDLLKKEILSLAQAYLVKVNTTPKLLAGMLQEMGQLKQGGSPNVA
jgi:DNA-binding response OmpR family regulator